MEILLMEGGPWDNLVCQGGPRHIFSHSTMLIEEILDPSPNPRMLENVINVAFARICSQQ